MADKKPQPDKHTHSSCSRLICVYTDRRPNLNSADCRPCQYRIKTGRRK